MRSTRTVPSIHRLDREQWEMMMEGLRSVEPLLHPDPTNSQERELYVDRHAKWRVAMRSLESICPVPLR